MHCPSNDQLAEIALGDVEDARLAEHVAACGQCRTELARLAQVSEELARAHSALQGGHVNARARLLAALETVPFVRYPSFRRVAAISVGICTIAVVVLLVVASPLVRLSAMERMARAVRDVKSYTYRMTEHVVHSRDDDSKRLTVDLESRFYWRAPNNYREELKIVGKQSPGDRSYRVDVVVVNPADTPGIIIDREAKTYFRVPVLRSEDLPSGSPTYPMNLLHAVREESGTIRRHLGTRRFQGAEAQGYEMMYERGGPITVWIDSQTDLPREIQQESRDDETMSDLRVGEFRWDIDLAPKLFDATPPAGYIDITPPTDEKKIAAIIEGLKQYAALSGGEYPDLADFDPATIRAKMQSFGLADSARLEQAVEGLELASQIILAKYHTGYFGQSVGPSDRDKVLLWWTIPRDRYCVIYGDLRTEVLDEAEWKKIAPPEKKWGDD